MLDDTVTEFEPTRTITICIPVYNDSRSATLLLHELDTIATTLPHTLQVLFIDDGSSERQWQELPGPTRSLPRVEVLRLRRNLGHQRAIAIGLAALAARGESDLVVVMDGDGEDTPASLPRLLGPALGDQPTAAHTAIFAERLKRHDGAGFLAGYRVFRLLHRLLVGEDIKVGNFSVLPRAVLDRVVGISEIWNHYAAGVVHARIPVTRVPIARGRRLAGQSKMNLPALVMHGISALSVWSDVIVARLFLAVGGLLAGAVALLAGSLVLRLFSVTIMQGWTPGIFGLLLVVTLLGIVCLLLALFVLGSRSATTMLPHRDWQDYILPDPPTHQQAAAEATPAEDEPIVITP